MTLVAPAGFQSLPGDAASKALRLGSKIGPRSQRRATFSTFRSEGAETVSTRIPEEDGSTFDSRGAPEQGALLQRLLTSHQSFLADFDKLRADFDDLVGGLEASGVPVPPRLQREGGPTVSADFIISVAQSEDNSISPVSPQRTLRRERSSVTSLCASVGDCAPAGASIENVMALPRFATMVFADAGQAAWHAALQASRSARLTAKAVQEERIFVFGGREDDSETYGHTSAESLDIHSGKWEAEESFSLGRFGHTGTAVGSCFYVCGGQGGDARSAIFFDPARGCWSSLAPMNRARTYAAAVAMNNALYIVGGTDSTHVWNSMERYYPMEANASKDGACGASTWVTIPGWLGHRRSLGAVALQGKVFACGGSNEPTDASAWTDAGDTGRTAELFSLVTGASAALPNMQTARMWHSATVGHGEVLVCGGSSPGNGCALASVESYCPSAHCWSELLPMEHARKGHAAAVVAGGLYILGGASADTKGCLSISSVQRLDLATGNWEELQPMQAQRGHFCVGVIPRGPTAARCVG